MEHQGMVMWWLQHPIKMAAKIQTGRNTDKSAMDLLVSSESVEEAGLNKSFRGFKEE